MKKLIVLIVCLMCLLCLLTGCVGGEHLEHKNNTDYRVLINSGSVFVYEFKDADTGVWYIANEGGVIPKLNDDGSLYRGASNNG